MSDKTHFVQTINNQLFYVGEVTAEGALEFLAQLASLTESHRRGRSYSPPAPVEVVLNTYGGDVAAAVMMGNALARVPSVIIGDGIVMSAGVIILLHATVKRVSAPHTVYMIHSSRMGTYGTLDVLEGAAHMLKAVDDMIYHLLTHKLNMKKTAARNLISRERVLNYKQALDVGLVTEVWEGGGG